MESTPRESAAAQSPPSSTTAPAAHAPSAPPPRVEPPPRGVSWLQRVFGWALLLAAGFAVASLMSYAQVREQYYDTTGGISEKYHSGETLATDKVAIISISGVIVDGEGFVQHQIEKVRQDEKVRAIVVRVNSPGGSVSGSDYIFHQLTKLRDEKKVPLVVSMGDLAASGGYYVSMAVGGQKDAIFAEPTTTTGSIGVIIPHYDLTGLLSEKLNIKDDSIASGDNKQMLSMTREMTPEQRQLAQDYVDAAFARFKEVIKEGRPMFQKDPEALDQLATGEIFWAPKAQENGLIDKIGFLEDAIDRARELARLPVDKTIVVRYQRPQSLLGEMTGGLAQSSGLLQEKSLLEMGVPRAYYLFTTLPPLAVSRDSGH
ncbi:MAG: signal peptide peptidase SppA [Pirellulaceae bacterium]